jgi:DNA-binding CsgD family transcriptional regulator
LANSIETHPCEQGPKSTNIQQRSEAVDFIIRPLEQRDFPACLELLRGHLAYPASILPELPKVWGRLLHEDALVAIVVESGSLDSMPGTILGFGLVVFVTDAWAAAAQTGEEPYLTVRTIRQELSGSSPILRPTAIRRANSGSGLNVLHLHYGEARLSEELRAPVRSKVMLAFIEYMRGYRIKGMIQELWDEVPPQAILNGPYPIVKDYAAYFDRQGEPPPPLGQRAFLGSLTREDILGNYGHIAAPVFVHTPPRLGFTRAEQRMLRQAVFGYTDVELARRLQLALPTIKNRWRALYDRLGHIAPELVHEIGCSSNQAVRGHEKRRRMLEYVRRHPEELRPGLWQTRPVRKKSAAG